MQILCFLTPAISINANTLDNGVKKTAKTQKHVHLQRSQLPDCWSKDTKRHLAAQVRSANGLRGIFKFSEILGRPSYRQQRAHRVLARGIKRNKYKNCTVSLLWISQWFVWRILLNVRIFCRS